MAPAVRHVTKRVVLDQDRAGVAGVVARRRFLGGVVDNDALYCVPASFGDGTRRLRLPIIRRKLKADDDVVLQFLVAAYRLPARRIEAEGIINR